METNFRQQLSDLIASKTDQYQLELDGLRGVPALFIQPTYTCLLKVEEMHTDREGRLAFYVTGGIAFRGLWEYRPSEQDCEKALAWWAANEKNLFPAE